MSEIKAGDEITIQVKVKVDRRVDNAVTFGWDNGKFIGWLSGCALVEDLESMIVP